MSESTDRKSRRFGDDDLSLGLAETEGSAEIWTQQPGQRSLAQGLEFTLCMR